MKSLNSTRTASAMVLLAALSACGGGGGGGDEPPPPPPPPTQQNSFAVGGSIDGLVGSGLTMQNNGGDDYQAAGNGPFVFANRITSGTYSVVVTAQPSNPTQVCTVNNGAGSIQDADVTNVVVTCAAPQATSYQVGGSATVQNGATVEIDNAGASTQVLANDETFAFTVPAGQAYDIRVNRNPVGQVCRVDNGSAAQATQDVNNVAVVCENATVAQCTGTVDSDGDTLTDCNELNVHGTNPFDADTDGDGYADNVEIQRFNPANDNYRFNPRIADLPVIAVELTSLPQVELNFEQSNGSSRTVGTQHGTGSSSSIARDWGGEISRQVEVSHTLNVETTNTVGATVSVSPTDLGGEASYERSLTLGFSTTSTQAYGSSVNWNSSQTTENTRTYNESVDASETVGTTYTNGNIAITARVVNDGHLAYDLENLTMSAYLYNPAQPFNFNAESIGTLFYGGSGTFPTTTIVGGDRSAVLNFSTNISLGKAQRLLRDSRNIVVTPASYRLTGPGGASRMLAEEDVAAKTATVIVDYGTHVARQDKYRVAIDRGDGQQSINAAVALSDVLHLPFTQGAGQWVFGNEAAARTTNSGLLSLRGYAMSASTNRYWLVAHNHNTDGGAGERQSDVYNLLMTGYDLSNIVLRAGDKLSIVYVGDADRDGLSDKFETDYGTDPNNLDTDGDGLQDGEEIYGWLTNLASPPCDQGTLTRVYSNPLQADSDADGTTDDVEKAACANPSFAFTVSAGPDQTTDRSANVTLSATISSTTSISPTYRWTLISGPDVTTASGNVRELDGRTPSFTAPNDVATLTWEVEATADGVAQTDRVRVQVFNDRNKRAVFVGETTSSSPDGTQGNPYPGLAEALPFVNAGDDIYVMTQSMPYQLSNTFVVPTGSSVFGGYDADWVRNVTASPTPVQLTARNDMQPVIRANAYTAPTYISGLAIVANNGATDVGVSMLGMLIDGNDAPGPVHVIDNIVTAANVASGTSAAPGSSYALMVRNVQAARIYRNQLNAGNGGRAAPGAGGTRGTDGDAAGTPGRGAGKVSGENEGGGGGDWGRGPAGGGGRGGNGQSIDGTTGGSGGSGAGGCKNATSVGGDGGDGAPGALGAGGGEFNRNVSAGFSPAPGVNGTSGRRGSGGGGGGGGGGCGTAGGGWGGGGGEGGGGGTPGFGGSGGGASVGVWIDNVANADLRDNTIVSATGGAGGNSGAGGGGGSGGRYGNGGAPGENCFLGLCDRGGYGARGGWGGDGGAGGRGGAGSGGPSIGVFVTTGSAPVLTRNAVRSGTGGNGGHYGNSGNGGHSYAVFDANPNDGQVPVISGTENVLTPGTAGASGVNSGTGSARGANGTSAATNF